MFCFLLSPQISSWICRGHSNRRSLSLFEPNPTADGTPADDLGDLFELYAEAEKEDQQFHECFAQTETDDDPPIEPNVTGNLLLAARFLYIRRFAGPGREQVNEIFQNFH